MACDEPLEIDFASCVDPSLPAGCMRIDNVVGPAPTPGVDEALFAEQWRIEADRERLIQRVED